MNARPRQETTEIRDQILEAANERFIQFGYGKTTMAEIARDCEMSAANLYRYFENKQDIAASLACQCLDTMLMQMSDVVADVKRPASERLRALVITLLHYTYKEWSENPRLNEMVNEVCEARSDIVEEFHAREHALLIELLGEGQANGEFELDDPEDTASALITATTLFRLPLLMPLYSLEVFEQKAEALVQLVLKGILKHP